MEDIAVWWHQDWAWHIRTVIHDAGAWLFAGLILACSPKGKGLKGRLEFSTPVPLAKGSSRHPDALARSGLNGMTPVSFPKRMVEVRLES